MNLHEIYLTAQIAAKEVIKYGGSSKPIDTQVNGESENAVQNKAIYDFVNSSVANNTAYFKGTYNSVAELETIVNATNNDYAFVVSVDIYGNTVYNRYKYNGNEWLFEYALNNSSFTANQWNTINSGITSADIQNLQDGKVDKIAGKGLSTNDFTDADKSKLDSLENYDDTEIKVEIAETAEQEALNRSTLGYQRKNLLKVSSRFVSTTSGVTVIQQSDGKLVVSGTNTATYTNYIFNKTYDNHTISNGKALFIKGAETISNCHYMVGITTATGTNDWLDIPQNGLVIPSDVTIRTLYVQQNTVGQEIYAEIYPLVQLAEIQDTTYEPYKPSVEEQISNQFDIISSIIDLGAKNIFLDNLGESKTTQGITLLKNNDAYHCEGTPINPENTFFNLNYVNSNVLSIPKGKYMCLFSSTDTNIGISICFNGAVKVSNKKSNFEFEIPSDTINSWARLQFNTSQIINGDVKIAIIPKAIYDVSPSYQPPSMTNSELTKIIKDLLQSISLLESRVLTLEGGIT